MKAKPLRETVAHRIVPIYAVRLLIVVTNDVAQSRWNRNNLYGELKMDVEGCGGLHSYDGFRFGIFLDRACLTHEVIAHEVLHATHRILEWHGVPFLPSNHEPFAALCGWLTTLAYTELKLAGERVKLKWPFRKYRKGEPRLKLLGMDEMCHAPDRRPR